MWRTWVFETWVPLKKRKKEKKENKNNNKLMILSMEGGHITKMIQNQSCNWYVLEISLTGIKSWETFLLCENLWISSI